MKHILFCLGFETFDKHLIEYVEKVPQLFSKAHLHFLHVYHPITSGVTELTSEQLKDYVQSLGFSKHSHTHFAVSEGSSAQEILKYIEKKEIELVVLGKQNFSPGAGYIASQLASRSPASLLLVTDDNLPRLEHLLFATDFSSCADYAYLELMRLIQVVPSIKKISFLSTYNVPAGYFKSGFTYDDIAKQLKISIEKGLEEWLNRMPSIGTPKESIIEEEQQGTAATILAVAERMDVDLICMGSHGHSRLASFLLGSTTDRMIRLHHQYPIFIARNPHDPERKIIKNIFQVE
jgi:nucleotide-binding universal stress UspA family protein